MPNIDGDSTYDLDMENFHDMARYHIEDGYNALDEATRYGGAAVNDLMFHIAQAFETSIKYVLIFFGLPFTADVKTHELELLCGLFLVWKPDDCYLEIPQSVADDPASIGRWSVDTRYAPMTYDLKELGGMLLDAEEWLAEIDEYVESV